MKRIKNLKYFIMNICFGLLTAILIVAIPIINVLAFKTYPTVLEVYLGVVGATVDNYDTNQYFDREAPNYQDVLDRTAILARMIEAEGCVLLKNEGNALPLKSGTKVSCFSQSSVDFIYGVTAGSGASGKSARATLQEALENEGIKVNSALWKFYKEKNYKRVVGGLSGGVSYYEAYPFQINEIPYSAYTKTVKESYRQYNDAAIVVIARTGCENGDLPRNMSVNTSGKNTGSILELDSNEREMLENVCKEFNKVIVILNTSNPMECGFLDEYGVDACLWVGGVGDYGISSVAQIISGKRNPSGRLVDTYAYDAFSSPAMQNMGNFEYWSNGSDSKHRYVTYAEGIYVGYKYYETRYEDAVLGRGKAGNYDYDKTVQYPFGYGLSYTSFKWSDFKATLKDGKVQVTLTVENTGKEAGKDVVEIYYQSPYTEYDKQHGVEKSAISLAGFVKTDNLSAGGKQKVTVEFDVEDMKSYDANGKGTYYLEASDDYYVTAAKDAHSAINNILKAKDATLAVDGDKAFVKKLTVAEKVYDKDAVSGNEVGNLFTDTDGTQYHNEIKYLSRSDWSVMENDGLRFGTANGKDNDGEEYKAELPAALKQVLETKGYAASGAPAEDFETPQSGVKGDAKLIEMKDKDFDDPAWEGLLNQVTVSEMSNLIRLSGYKTSSIVSVGKPYTTDADGPQSWNSFIGDGISTGGLPYAIVIASTWSTDIAERVGYMMGELCLWIKLTNKTQPNLTGWYAPAMNIHRTPFGGRNFEYYSEDSILSAEIGAHITKRATERGVVCYIKHFAMNEQDRGRMTDNVTWAQEQAIREIYLKPFETSIKVGRSLAVMTSYNRIGTTWAGGNYNLITGVLRKEWGFNGFVLTDYLDGNWENVDQMLAAGGDAALNIEDQNSRASLTTSGAQARTYMRRATHHALYAFVNSNAMNGIDHETVVSDGTPVYYFVMCGINIALGVAVLWFIVSIIINFTLWLIEKLKKPKASANKHTVTTDGEVKA